MNFLNNPNMIRTDGTGVKIGDIIVANTILTSNENWVLVVGKINPSGSYRLAECLRIRDNKINLSWPDVPVPLSKESQFWIVGRVIKANKGRVLADDLNGGTVTISTVSELESMIDSVNRTLKKTFGPDMKVVFEDKDGNLVLPKMPQDEPEKPPEKPMSEVKTAKGINMIFEQLYGEDIKFGK